MDQNEINEEHKKEAKNNGFIVLGKTGVGKSNFLNALTGKMVAKSERNLNPVTTKTSIIYHKLKNNKWIALIDTPGLGDPKVFEDKEFDENTLKMIKQCIKDNKIHVRGILFLTNFQIERFDADEQKTLCKYNKIFPLKKFWEHIIIIFTHFYGDSEGGISAEEIKQVREKSNSEIFKQIMERVKKVSNVIEYSQLDIRYTNLYFPIKNEVQKNNNTKYVNELEESLTKLSEKEHLFCRIEICHFKNYRFQKDEDKKFYLGEVEIIGYFDINEKPLKEDFIEIDVREIQKDEKDLPKPELAVEAIKAEEDENNNLYHKTIENPPDSYYWKAFKTIIGGGIGGAIAGGLGLLLGGIIGAPIVPVIGAGGLIIGSIIGAKS
jgi:GTP-binding protein EngB required for normal cell division